MLYKFDRYYMLDLPALYRVYSESISADYGRGKYDFSPQVEFAQDLQQFLRCPGAYLAVWVAQNRYVAAVRVEPYEDGYLLSCLETDANDRRQGNAEALLCCIMEENPGAYYVHIQKKNFPSVALHQKLGFQIIQDYATYVDGSVSSQSFTLKRLKNR